VKKGFMIFILLFLAITLGCSQTPSEETFNVGFTVSSLTPEVNEEFNMNGLLLNRSKHTYEIHHAGGVFYFFITDKEGKEINSFMMSMVGITRKLKGETTIPENYKYTFETPGTYKVWAIAKFSVGNDSKQYEYKTEVMEIHVT
jgi:hypothetical protein